MINAEHSRLIKKLKYLQAEFKSFSIEVYFLKQWMWENTRRENSYEWYQYFNTYNIMYRPIMRDLANEIRDIKQKIKKVNGKKL